MPLLDLDQHALWNPEARSGILRISEFMENDMSKRELIEPHEGDKRFVRRDAQGHFKQEVDVGASLAADRRQHSTTKKPRGEGDKGD
jgi:hypothetical protein